MSHPVSTLPTEAPDHRHFIADCYLYGRMFQIHIRSTVNNWQGVSSKEDLGNRCRLENSTISARLKLMRNFVNRPLMLVKQHAHVHDAERAHSPACQKYETF